MRSCKSLPPLVEGKIHGYLKLVIDAIAWSRRSPGSVSVVASWWGEPSSVRFRPVSHAEDDVPANDELSHVYAIKTNLNLFKEYIRKCEILELVIVPDKTDHVIGTAEITNLLDIFRNTCVSRYYDLISPDAEKLGEIHVSLSLSHITVLDTNIESLKPVKPNTVTPTYISSAPMANDLKYENFIKRKDDYKTNSSRPDTANVYKSILKEKKDTMFEDIIGSLNTNATEKLVAQVIEKAQRLRGAMIKETQTEDPFLFFNDKLLSKQSDLPLSVENEANLYKYILGKDMTLQQEKEALNTLRSISPTSSLIEFASDSINKQKLQHSQNVSKTLGNQNFLEKKFQEVRQSTCNRSKEPFVLDHVDSIKITIESFSLNATGYRRVKSSCISCSDNMPLQVTYFVQYDTSIFYANDTKKKELKNTLIKVSTKTQTDMVVYFDHSGTYNISMDKLSLDSALKFKLFIRHLNQKSLTELGTGSMYIRDIIKTDTWSITQHIAIINKGIKVGELNVTAELGRDSIHFGKQYVDTMSSSNKDVPSLKTQCLLNKGNHRVKRVTGTESKPDNHTSASSGKTADSMITKNNIRFCTPQFQTRQRDENTDGIQINIRHQESSNEEKILLHGLIHISEGRQLPVLNTYLKCKTWWKEGDTISYVSENTENPMYQFRQIVQFMYGKDLLNRLKNNYIIMEVYSKYNGTDELLGLAKLSVHQLYVAYNNPRILPRILSSKYPIISVDGWVPIMDPITGKTCGELLALIALGTLQQIEALEVSREYGNVASRTNKKMPHDYILPHVSPKIYRGQDLPMHNVEHPEQNLNRSPAHNSTTFYGDCISEKETIGLESKCEAIQTDISMATENKSQKSVNSTDSEHAVLNRLVDRLSQVLISGKSSVNQAAQTETDLETIHSNTDEVCVTELNFNNTSDDSDSSQLPLPTEAYRSVGVGAEYDEEIQQLSQSVNCDHTESNSLPEQYVPEEVIDEYTPDSFRAIVEIQSALHLSTVERGSEICEPSTYVTFQAKKSDLDNCSKSFLHTDITPYTCNPEWNWKADVRLSTELLLNNEKRLILKIWRVNNRQSATQIDLDNDIVLGFAAVDLTILLNGFPMISGWFHIMDFTGKCNGQIQIRVTPLDNLSSLAKSPSVTHSTRGQVYASSQTDWIVPNPLDTHLTNMDQNNKRSPLPATTYNEDPSRNVNASNISTMNATHFLENGSISILSHTLKQKLTELDEITKRLQSRLHDVTSTAFEDDFDTDFDLNEPACHNEKYEAVNDTSTQKRGQFAPKTENILETPENGNHSDKTNINTHALGLSIVENRSDVDYPSPSSNYAMENSQNLHPFQNKHEQAVQYDTVFNNINDYPARGAKVHINHLLDKLSLQPTVRPLSSGSIPLGRNIIELLQNLHQSNNNLEHNNKRRSGVTVCTVPTQTDNLDDGNIQNPVSGSTSDFTLSNSESSQPVIRTEIGNKMSDVLRDELIAEEESGVLKSDELSTYLITSNVRHMDLDTMVNPLVYPHLMPDLDTSTTASPEGDPAEQLDNYYSKVFCAAINEKLKKTQTKTNETESNLLNSQSEVSVESVRSAEHSRISPSGVSTYVDGNIDLTVVHKTCYDDLLAMNSTKESERTGCTDELSVTGIPMITSESACSHPTETSESPLSRQAPEGGNPVEDHPNQPVKQQRSNSRESTIS